MWRKLKTWLLLNNRGVKMLAIFLVFGASFFVMTPAFAQSFGKQIAGEIAELLFYIVQFFGWLILKVVEIIISVSQYTGFTDSPAVQKGWTIVRDVTNMFFIVVMLYIAFRTMFGQEANWQSSLIRLILAAIVINFSRTICGLIIDASQVVMLTFVNGLKDAAGGNFIDMFQLRQMLTQPTATGSDLLFFVLLALVMSFSSLVIITLLLIFLIVRIIFLWVLIILSPLAFFLKLSPVGGDMWGKWYSKFKEQVLTGPILAFFLWLSLLTTQETNNALGAVSATGAGDTLGIPILGNVNLQGYIVGLAMLVVSMMAARAVGGATFAQAEGYYDRYTGRGSRLRSYGKALGGAALTGAGRLLDRGAGYVLTGGRYRVSDLGYLANKKIVKPAVSAVGGVLGLTEEAKLKEQIATFNRRGQHHEAEEAEKKLLSNITHDLENKYTSDQLATKLAAGDFKDYEAKAAAGMVAKKGHWMLKGKGAEITSFAKGAGLSEEQEYELREQLEKAGDKNAWLGFDKNKRARAENPNQSAEDQIKGTLKGLDEKEINDLYKGVSKGIQDGFDGRANQTHAAFALQQIETAQFNKLSQGTKNEVLAALKTAAAKDPANNAVYLEKVEEFANEMLVPLQESYLKAQKDGNTNAMNSYQNKMDSISSAHLVGIDALKVQGAESLKKGIQSTNKERVKAIHRGASFAEVMPGIDRRGNSVNASAASGLNSIMTDASVRADLLMTIDPGQISDKSSTLAKAIAQNVDAADMEHIAAAGKSEQYYAIMDVLKQNQNLPNVKDIMGDLENSTSKLKEAEKQLETKLGAVLKGVATGAVIGGAGVLLGPLSGVATGLAANFGVQRKLYKSADKGHH